MLGHLHSVEPSGCALHIAWFKQPAAWQGSDVITRSKLIFSFDPFSQILLWGTAITKGKNTGSRLFTEVKPCWTGLISGWVTISIKYPVLYSLGSQAGVVDINHAFHLYYNDVCGSSFSRSQPDFEGFLRGLRFPRSTKLTPSFIQYIYAPLITVRCTEGLSWVNIRIIIIIIITV